MLPKVLAVIILAVAIWAYPPTHAYAIPFFVIALAAVFVIEGVRVVPQQSAWVVERWGRYHSTLIIPSNVSDVAGLVASAMSVLDKTRLSGAGAAR